MAMETDNRGDLRIQILHGRYIDFGNTYATSCISHTFSLSATWVRFALSLLTIISMRALYISIRNSTTRPGTFSSHPPPLILLFRYAKQKLTLIFRWYFLQATHQVQSVSETQSFNSAATQTKGENNEPRKKPREQHPRQLTRSDV